MRDHWNSTRDLLKFVGLNQQFGPVFFRKNPPTVESVDLSITLAPSNCGALMDPGYQFRGVC